MRFVYDIINSSWTSTTRSRRGELPSADNPLKIYLMGDEPIAIHRSGKALSLIAEQPVAFAARYFWHWLLCESNEGPIAKDELAMF